MCSPALSPTRGQAQIFGCHVHQRASPASFPPRQPVQTNGAGAKQYDALRWRVLRRETELCNSHLNSKTPLCISRCPLSPFKANLSIQIDKIAKQSNNVSFSVYTCFVCRSDDRKELAKLDCKVAFLKRKPYFYSKYANASLFLEIIAKVLQILLAINGIFQNETPYI